MELDKLIKQVENADAQSKHGESWKIINRISGKKSARKGLIKGNTKEERIEKWFNHFKGLFGKSEDGLKAEEIEDGLFTKEELRRPKEA